MLKEGDEWNDDFADESEEHRQAVQEVADRFYEMFKDYEVAEEELNNIPREIIYIPAEIPSVDVVHTVSLDLKGGSEENKFLVGNPIKSELSIYSSYNWNLTGTPSVDIECYYDINLDPDVWLISGSKRAQFTVEHDTFKVFEMTLVPLKSGIIPIPKVEIEVLTSNILSEVEDASFPDVVVLPTRFTAVYKVDVPDGHPQ